MLPLTIRLPILGLFFLRIFPGAVVLMIDIIASDVVLTVPVSVVVIVVVVWVDVVALVSLPVPVVMAMPVISPGIPVGKERRSPTASVALEGMNNIGAGSRLVSSSSASSMVMTLKEDHAPTPVQTGALLRPISTSQSGWP